MILLILEGEEGDVGQDSADFGPDFVDICSDFADLDKICVIFNRI